MATKLKIRLLVVSTMVGGIPEVLPGDMILMAEPRAKALTDALHRAIGMVRRKVTLPPDECHKRVADMYQWDDVAARTEKVYDKAAQDPDYAFTERLQRYYSGRPVAGILYGLVVILDFLLLCLLELLRPAKYIDIVPNPRPVRQT
eukprot:m.72328 g.72328  ORF g.72328 m.72328 type:complete len:146 (+) comp35790_c0_seq37:996-1433(+)